MFAVTINSEDFDRSRQALTHARDLKTTRLQSSGVSRAIRRQERHTWLHAIQEYSATERSHIRRKISATISGGKRLIGSFALCSGFGGGFGGGSKTMNGVAPDIEDTEWRGGNGSFIITQGAKGCGHTCGAKS
jgi:hypothetical protein